MKNTLLTALVLAFCSFNLHAQELNFGIKGGLNLSTVAGDVPDAINPRVGYHFGGFVNISLSDRFSLHPEVLYFSIGNTFSQSLNELRTFDLDPVVQNSDFKVVTRANFLAVPLSFRFNFTNNFALDFGPQISFLLNTVIKVKEIPDNMDAFNSSDSGNFRPDYGANIGFTFTPNEKMNVQLRYYQGLKNLSKSSVFVNQQSSNVALQLSVGYIIF